jgi:hypothetical protein
MARNIGYKVRPVKEMEVFYGQDYTSGLKQTRTLPVEAGVAKVWSGEVIYSKGGTNPTGGKYNGELSASTWVKTQDEGVSKVPHFAVYDSDRFDVDASGKLLALVGTDTFQLGTCLYDHTKAYNDGDPLYVTKQNTVGQVPELDKAPVPVSGLNILTSDDSVGGDIVGYVVDGVISLKGNVGITSANGTYTAPDGYNVAQGNIDTVFSGGPALWTEATPSDTMLKFTTKWVPAE